MLGTLNACSRSVAIGDSRPADPNVLEKIKPGKSTKSNVQDLLGTPKRVVFPDLKREHWIYTYEQAQFFYPFVTVSADNASLKDSNFTVEFNAKGIVSRLGKGAIK